MISQDVKDASCMCFDDENMKMKQDMIKSTNFVRCVRVEVD